jgi:hypothetical protein
MALTEVRHMLTPTARRVTRWIVMLPILMVGSMFFWSLAIGLGGLSLMAASSMQMVEDPPCGGIGRLAPSVDVTDTIGPGSITIQLEESTEPEDVNDNSGAGGFPVTDDDQSVATPGPGATSL